MVIHVSRLNLFKEVERQNSDGINTDKIEEKDKTRFYLSAKLIIRILIRLCNRKWFLTVGFSS